MMTEAGSFCCGTGQGRKENKMTLFPMFLKLEGRSCLVVGAGTIGEPKIEQPVDLRRLDPRDCASRDARRLLSGRGREAIVWEAREFRTSRISTVFFWSSQPRLRAK